MADNLHKTQMTDDKLLALMGKIQTAIEALEKTAADIEKPTMSQVRMVEQSSTDLRKLAEDLQSRQRVR